MEKTIVHKNFELAYRWYSGPVIGRFLGEMKTNQRLIGPKCSGCGTVFVPPPDVCPKCFLDLKDCKDWVEVKDTGILTAHTMVYVSFPNRPVEAPYAVGLIKLDGADTQLVHLVKVKGDAYLQKSGVRVKACWKKEREGSILDILYFEEE